MGKRSHPEDGQAPNGDPVETVAQKLGSAGIHLERFIDVKEGRKHTFDHTQCSPDEVSGNYGVYCGQGLLGVDIDDRIAWDETPGTEDLEETFTVSTPHDGEHRYYRVTTEVPFSIMAMAGGSLNPSLPWGELYTSKYLVGPGSEIHDCEKPDCYACKVDNPGRYEIEVNRPIARISSDEIAPLLQNRSEVAGARQAAIAEFSENAPNYQTPTRTGPATASGGTFTFQLQLGEEKPADPDKRILWGIVRSQAGGLPKEGARFDKILDQAGENGIDCFRTSRVIRSWLECGALRRAPDSNRLIPQRERWEQ